MSIFRARPVSRKKKTTRKHSGAFLAKMSRFGKTLLFPIAMLPIAAILLRIGSAIPQGDALKTGSTVLSNFLGVFISDAGNVVFKTLPVLFAMSIAFGLTKKQRGEAAVIGFLGISLVLVFLSSPADSANKIPPPTFFGGVDLIAKIWNPLIDFHKIFGAAYNDIFAMNVLNGVLVGLLVAYLYNKFSEVEMPGILGFFSGSRLLPVVIFVTLMVGIFVYVLVWPWVAYGIYEFSRQLVQVEGNRFSNAAVMFVYGIMNRLLLPFGLHHIPNTLFWFSPLGGQHPGIDGGYVYGDINIFLNGVPKGNTAGTFQTGFFPIFMFGLPALVAAIWKTALPSQRVRALGLLGGAAFITFFTGITEPVEFAFLYVAPVLYGMHVLYTGLFGFIVGLFGIQLGFGFSAGFIDFVLSIPKSLQIIHANYTGIDAFFRNPFFIIPIGCLTAFAYYYTSKFLILKYDMPTPGRKDNLLLATASGSEVDSYPVGPSMQTGVVMPTKKTKFEIAATKILQGLGGAENVLELTNCATRLRVTLRDETKLNKDLIKSAGAYGTVKLGRNAVQVIMGPKVELYANAVNALMNK